MAVMGADYDVAERWDAAYDYAMTKQSDSTEAMAFADWTGGDGGEKTIASRWTEWMS